MSQPILQYASISCAAINNNTKVEDLISYFFWTTGTSIKRVKIANRRALFEYETAQDAQTSLMNQDTNFNSSTMRIKYPIVLSELACFALVDWKGDENVQTQTTIEGVVVPALPGGRKHLQCNMCRGNRENGICYDCMGA